MKVTVIVPMYNESSIIEESVKTYHDYMEKTFEDFELIFVNDGSKDTCGEYVKEAMKTRKNLSLVEYQPNRGKGYAVRQGVLASKGDIVIYTDADIAYGTEVIGKIAEIMANDESLALTVGSRNLDGHGYDGYTFVRKVASKMYIKFLKIVGGLKLSDSQCGFKAFRGDVARKIFPYCEIDRFAFDFEALLLVQKINGKIGEMPVKIINHRESKVNVLRDSVKMLRDIRKMKKRIKKLEIK